MGLWLSGTYTRSRVEARRSPTTTDLDVAHRTTTTTAAALLVASGKQCQASLKRRPLSTAATATICLQSDGSTKDGPGKLCSV